MWVTVVVSPCPLGTLFMTLDGRGVDKAIALGPLGCSAVILVVPDILYVKVVHMSWDISADRE